MKDEDFFEKDCLIFDRSITNFLLSIIIFGCGVIFGSFFPLKSKKTEEKEPDEYKQKNNCTADALFKTPLPLRKRAKSESALRYRDKYIYMSSLNSPNKQNQHSIKTIMTSRTSLSSMASKIPFENEANKYKQKNSYTNSNFFKPSFSVLKRAKSESALKDRDKYIHVNSLNNPSEQHQYSTKAVMTPQADLSSMESELSFKFPL